ncbi:MAG TPA: hypothetical protein DIT64_14610 [Verrucomicrobiales bacterium]|nr:hypothetical protein [Verrucomicrobiales bacterium]
MSFGQETKLTAMTPEAFLLCIGAAAVVVLLLLRYWPRSPVRSVERFIRQIEAGERPEIPARTNYDHDLVLTDNGFEIRALKEQTADVVSVAWECVTEASAYKRDLWSTDQICIAFTMDNETFIEIHEEMRGFCDLCERLPAVLPGALAFGSWYQEITVPAFEPCLTRLFTREPSPLRA